MIRSLDDFERSPADFGQRRPQFISGIATIGEDMAQPWEAVADAGEHIGGAIAVLNVGGMDLRSRRTFDGSGKTASARPTRRSSNYLARPVPCAHEAREWYRSTSLLSFGSLQNRRISDPGRRQDNPLISLNLISAQTVRRPTSAFSTRSATALLIRFPAGSCRETT